LFSIRIEEQDKKSRNDNSEYTRKLPLTQLV